MFIEHEKISCGCCRSHDENDRCTCHIHQDIPRGLRAKVCSFHQTQDACRRESAGDAQVDRRP
jgi:hypothetical protein